MSKHKLAKLNRLLTIKQRHLEIRRQELIDSHHRLEKEIRKAHLLQQRQVDALACDVQTPGGVAALSQIQRRSRRLEELQIIQREVISIAKNHHEKLKIEITQQHASVKAWKKYVAKLENEIAVSIATAEMVLADDAFLMKQRRELK